MSSLRASSAQRERVVASLGHAYREGLLSTGTFELRVEAALAGRTVTELQSLVDDLRTWTRVRLALVARLWQRSRPAAAVGPAAELLLPSGDAPPRLTVGRHPDCDVVLDDPTVSRLHASLRRERGRWVLHDLGSLNGTWLQGRRTHTIEVRAGDTVRFGDVAARLR